MGMFKFFTLILPNDNERQIQNIKPTGSKVKHIYEGN